MIFIVQSQNNLQKIASLNFSFSYSISKGCAVKFRPFTSSALNRSIARCPDFYSLKYVARVGRAPGALLCPCSHNCNFRQHSERFSKLSIRFGWNLAHVPPSARWRWFPTDVFPAKFFLLSKITVFGVKFWIFFKFYLISRHGFTLALQNPAKENLQTVSGMLCEIFSSIGLKLGEI